MKRLLMLALITFAAVMVPGAAVAEPLNSVNLGMGGIIQTMPHCRAKVYTLEYERMLTPTITFLGRGSGVDYKFDDGTYREEGKPRGFDLGARVYSDSGMKGFFIGGTLGYWTSDWTFANYQHRPDEVSGKATSNSVRANLDMGWRLPVSSSLSVMPQMNVGRFFSSTSCDYTYPPSAVGTACSQDSEVKYYFFLALTVGVGF